MLYRNENEGFHLRNHGDDIHVVSAYSLFVKELACRLHCNDVIMVVMASQITSLTIVYSTIYSGADQRKHQSSASLAFLRVIHRWPVNSSHKWPVTRKCFHLMTSSCVRRYVMSLRESILTYCHLDHRELTSASSVELNKKYFSFMKVHSKILFTKTAPIVFKRQCFTWAWAITFVILKQSSTVVTGSNITMTKVQNSQKTHIYRAHRRLKGVHCKYCTE